MKAHPHLVVFVGALAAATASVLVSVTGRGCAATNASACPTPVFTAANWFVSPTGSDSNTGTDAAHPFLTMGKAYRSASCGQVVQLTGTFTQVYTLAETRKTCSNGTYVTFQGPATFTGTNCGAEPCFALSIQTSDVALQNVTLQQTLSTNCCGAGLDIDTSCGATLTQNVLVNNVTGTRFSLSSVKNVTISNSTWSYQDDYATGGSHIYPKGGCSGNYPGDNIGVRVTHNTWVQSLPTSNCQAHNGGSVCHLDCLTVSDASPSGLNPGDSVWVDRNTFKNCNAIDVWWKFVPASGASSTMGGMLIENNDLQASVTGASESDLNCPDLSGDLVENSAYRYNSMQATALGLNVNNGSNCTYSNVRVVGNVMPSENCGAAGVTFGNNFVVSGACSGDTTVASLAYVNSPAMNLRLANGAAEIGGGNASFFPALDLDGNTRPVGAVTSSGAHDRS